MKRAARRDLCGFFYGRLVEVNDDMDLLGFNTSCLHGKQADIKTLDTSKVIEVSNA